MEPLQFVGRAQAPLIEEEWKQLDEAVVKAARRVLVGRKVLPVYNLADVGVMEVQWDELTEMSPATISMYGETPVEDIIVYTRKSRYYCLHAEKPHSANNPQRLSHTLERHNSEQTQRHTFGHG